jgi:hypothetical protein
MIAREFQPMGFQRDPVLAAGEYERLMVPARERFASASCLDVLRSSSDEIFLTAFLLHFCALGTHMTRPVEQWMRRAAERCAEIGLADIARALSSHARAEADHHLMMIVDVASLSARWNSRYHPPMNADVLLDQPPSPGVLQYCMVHENNIAGDAPYAQIAIQHEIEMLPVRFGEAVLHRCVTTLGPEILPCLSFVSNHIRLDVAHAKLNAALMDDVLRQIPESIPALVSAGSTTLDAYAAFLADCVRLARQESCKIHRPIRVRTDLPAVSWRFASPSTDGRRADAGKSGDWIEELQLFRGFALFDNGRRPVFQTQTGDLVDADPVDAHAHHLLAYSGGSLVGCVRAYRPVAGAPPCVTELLLGEHQFMRMLGRLGVGRTNVVEIGRWAVHPNHRLFGWLAAQLAAGSAVLANMLKDTFQQEQGIVICAAGSLGRQDAMLSGIGLVDVPDIAPIYCPRYDDTVRVLCCSTTEDLSPAFQHLMGEMATTLGLSREIGLSLSRGVPGEDMLAGNRWSAGPETTARSS